MKDLAGTTFGRLLVLSLEEVTSDSHTYWFCRCVCGEYTVVRASRLLKGTTRSCGCLRINFRVGK